MTKKKQKISDSKWGSVFKKFWWLVIVVIVGIGWLLYVAISSYMLQQRFASTYEQLDSVYKSLQESTQVASNSQGSITKTCRTNYYGFNSEIECGVDLEVYFTTETELIVQSKIESYLQQGGFKAIELAQTSKENESEGTGVFYSNTDMRCSCYWGFRGDINQERIVHLYCRETVPDFLPGYERQ